LEARHEEWKQLKGSGWDQGLSGVVDEDAALGKVVVEDFGGARVLDRLLMYERRMEHSLLKTLNDLQLRRLRVREYISRHMDEIGSPETGSFKCEVSSLGSTS